MKQTATSTTAYYEVDLAGNVRGLRASGGASLGGYRYSAFGQTLEDTTSITQPLRWKGRWWSPVAGGTYDVRARQWSPELGVFLSVDEFDFHEDKTTLWGWPNQNPTRFSDPQGRGFFCTILFGSPFCFYFPDPPPSPGGCKKPKPLPNEENEPNRVCPLTYSKRGEPPGKTTCEYTCTMPHLFCRKIYEGEVRCPEQGDCGEPN